MSVATSDVLLERLLTLHPKRIDLVLDRIERLLAALGSPEKKMPPVIHVAGTNGKGSTCAFSRAILEAQGLRVHVYTSPHLVHFHERIRLASGVIGEEELAATLDDCERANAGQPITFFEITTAAAFLAFSRHPADALVLEVGLGGKYDATNVIARPAVSVITPVDYDHQEFLGSQLSGIAAEKAGIIKKGAPVVVAPQQDEAREIISRRAAALGAPAKFFGEDFFAHAEHGRMVYQDDDGLLDLPLPKLVGAYQIENAAVSIAALRHAGHGWAREGAIERGLRSVEWPARMQRLTRGPLVALAPKGAEVWLDGGHNPHGALAVSGALADLEERTPKPLYLICGMLRTKDSEGFLAPFKGLARHVTTVAIEGEDASRGAGELYDMARRLGFEASPAEDLDDAMMQVDAWSRGRPADGPPRILICGSLYLAGKVLAANS
ncbi:MAG TPA: folylpolyglutamate synthase/dihydrofolate synthase family protein [Rhizomicrobium sp.]|jgi:dihydrofolate synthase/folylpolyglutamate synthase